MSMLIEIWGDYACFTRPEMKTERVSYDMITPSAARGLVEAHQAAGAEYLGYHEENYQMMRCFVEGACADTGWYAPSYMPLGSIPFASSRTV